MLLKHIGQKKKCFQDLLRACNWMSYLNFKPTSKISIPPCTLTMEINLVQKGYSWQYRDLSLGCFIVQPVTKTRLRCPSGISVNNWQWIEILEISLFLVFIFCLENKQTGKISLLGKGEDWKFWWRLSLAPVGNTWIIFSSANALCTWCKEPCCLAGPLLSCRINVFSLHPQFALFNHWHMCLKRLTG